MKRVVDQELDSIRAFFDQAAIVAKDATCQRAHCGTVIVKNGEIIGSGYNSPPLDDESRRTCADTWGRDKKPKYDVTCCVHAEWRAVLDACKTSGDKIKGATLYFMRVDEDGNFTDAGIPFCTVCSRLTMESGVGEFALWNDNGADVYSLQEYDALSFAYHQI